MTDQCYTLHIGGLVVVIEVMRAQYVLDRDALWLWCGGIVEALDGRFDSVLL